jgi:hypothetical protein
MMSAVLDLKSYQSWLEDKLAADPAWSFCSLDAPDFISQYEIKLPNI